MKKLIFTINVLTVIGSSLYAQNVRFVRSGIITYKKTVNMYAIIQRGINKENETLLKPAFEEYKQQHPQFKELESTLIFVDNKSIFTPADKATSVMHISVYSGPPVSVILGQSYR